MSLTDQQIAQLSSLLASLKQRVSDPLSCCDEAKTGVAAAEDLLDEVERLRAENQRLAERVAEEHDRATGALAEADEVVAATRQAAINGFTAVRQKLLAALGRKDDRRTQLVEYVADLAAERDQVCAELERERQATHRVADQLGALTMCGIDGCVLSDAIDHCHGEDHGYCCTEDYAEQDTGVAVHRDHLPAALMANLAAVRAELERARPVVEAAKALRSTWRGSSVPRIPEESAVAAAADAWTASEEVGDRG